MTITADDQTFATHLSMLSGLDQRVVLAWTVAETSGGTSGVRGYNFLNVGNTDTNPYGGSHWNSPAEAAQGTYTWLLQNPASGRQILASAGQSPQQQLSAIAASPFASSHYKDASGKIGGNLVRDYNGLTLGGRIGELIVPAPVGGAAQSAGSAALAPVKAVTQPIKDVSSLISALGCPAFRYGAAFVILAGLALVILFRKPLVKTAVSGAKVAAIA
jgi:hypothetical protein